MEQAVTLTLFRLLRLRHCVRLCLAQSPEHVDIKVNVTS